LFGRRQQKKQAQQEALRRSWDEQAQHKQAQPQQQRNW